MENEIKSDLSFMQISRPMSMINRFLRLEDALPWSVDHIDANPG